MHLAPELMDTLWALDAYWRDAVGYELIITSGRDGEHKLYSLHYVGNAADIRTWTSANSGRQITGTRRETILRMARLIAGDEFDVVNEGHHFHLEWQPSHLPETCHGSV